MSPLNKNNHFDNIVVGFNRFEDYIGNSPKHGASIGPVAGRIAGAAFELNGQTFQLEANNGLNCNHSGSSGWDSSVFEVEEVSNDGLTFYTERTDGNWRLSWQSENLGFLYPDREGKAGNLLSGPDRSGYLGQSDQIIATLTCLGISLRLLTAMSSN